MRSLASCCSRSTSAAVNCFVREPIWNFVSGSLGIFCSRFAFPYPLLRRISLPRATRTNPMKVLSAVYELAVCSRRSRRDASLAFCAAAIPCFAITQAINNIAIPGSWTRRTVSIELSLKGLIAALRYRRPSLSVKPLAAEGPRKPTDEALLAHDWFLSSTHGVEFDGKREFVSFDEYCFWLGLNAEAERLALLEVIDAGEDAFYTDEACERLLALKVGDPEDNIFALGA